jgi:GNAT superfamily N-acetyltransferase
MSLPGAPDLCVEPLSPRHDRADFFCGVAGLDAYLKVQAGQDVRRKANAVFILVNTEAPARILGYFTLCSTALAPGDIPEAARKHVSRYPLVSATLVGRLAIERASQGQGLGAILLARALRLASEASETIGSSMVVVDAIDVRAADFYAAHGFVRLPESRRLVLPMRLIERLLAP